jgi:preprotein translocase subunit SecG
VEYKNNRFLDKSTWTLATILIALILLSSFSFTGTLSDTDSKIIENTGSAAPATNTPVAPAQNTPAAQQIQQNKFLKYLLKCQPVKAGIFYKKIMSV